jgi:predicted kinase
MPNAPLHFLVGSTGAGKTTYALRFCNETGAVRFSIDEWMTALFWMDTPQPLQPAWSMERVERCSKQIWETALQVAKAGVPCMLEVGFASRANRYKYAELAARETLPVRLHVLDVPMEERWRRVQRRNQGGADQEQLAFALTREMFEFTETFWEPPTPEEMSEFAGLYVSS